MMVPKIPGIKVTLVAAFTLISSIPILTFGMFQARQRAQSEIVSEDRLLSDTAVAVARDVQMILDHHILALSTIGEQLRRIGKLNGPQVDQVLEVYRSKFKLRYVYLIGEDGIVTAAYPQKSSDGKPNVGASFADREYFQFAKRDGRPYIAQLRIGKFSGKPVFGLAVPVFDSKNQRVIAVLGSSLGPSDVSAAIRPPDGAEGIHFAVLDARTQRVTEKGLPDPSSIIDLSKNSLFKSLPETGVSIVEGDWEKEGPVRAAVTTVRTENIIWPVAAFESRSDILQATSRIRNQTWTFTAVLVALSSLLGLLFSHFLSAPIQELVARMQKIERGEYQSGVSRPKLAFREIASASQALDSMSSQLRTYTEDLEKVVAERTTQLLEASSALDEHRSKSITAAKLAALGEMAAGVAHEINNPLTIISGKVSQMENMIQDGSADRVYLLTSTEVLKRTVQRIARIIQGLRAFSRDGASDPLEYAKIGVILDNAMDLCRERFKKAGVALTVIPENYATSELGLDCRPVQISQVVLNLLINAFDAVQDRAEKWVRIEIEDAARTVRISVNDSGEGVPAEIRDKIMQPFFTTKQIDRATGLGLSVASGVVQDHGGTIFLDTESPHTKFVVELPKRQKQIVRS